MTELSKEVQTYIVQRLAMFETPQEVADSVKEEFDVEVSRQTVFWYNADKNPKLPKKWKQIFTATRKKFLSATVTIPIANKSYRLNELNKIFQKQKAAKSQNTKAMRETLEQAAKESGDAFSNKTKHEVEASVQHSVVRVPPKLSPDEWASQFAGAADEKEGDGSADE